MISRISKKLAIKIHKNDYKNLGDLEIYEYGLELILSSIINTFLIIALSACTGLAIEMLAFLVFFGILRISAGGYHAPTHFKCLLQYMVISFSSIIFARMMMENTMIIYLIIMSCILSAGLVFWLAPVDSNNKQLNNGEIRQFKKRSRVTVLIQIIILLALLYLRNNLSYYLFVCSLGILSESISLLPILNKKGEMSYEKGK